MKQKTENKPTRVRYTILAAVFINVVINYMDRSNISVAAPFLAKDLELSSVQMGFIFSAFGWTYATLQIPGGVMADRYGIRTLYTVCLILWSIATIFQGLATGFVVLLVLRVFIGIFEAPSYPMNNRIVTAWFPENERASAIAMYTSGQFIGLAFLMPALIYVEHIAGWRTLFYITGCVGLLWGIIWFFFYRTPSNHQKVNEAELSLIEKGGGIFNRKKTKEAEGEKFKWSNLWVVLSKRKLWGIYIGQFGLGATLMFFLTWFPKYLIEDKQLDFLKPGSSLVASVPFIFAFVGVLLSGFVSDYLVKKKVNAGFARKAPMVAGLLLSTSIMGANFVDSPFWVTFFLSLAFFGNGLASIAWVFVSLLSPKKLIGLTGGTFNFIGGLSGIIVPITIGYLVNDGDYSPALVFVSLMALMGALSYIFLVGKIERVEID